MATAILSVAFVGLQVYAARGSSNSVEKTSTTEGAAKTETTAKTERADSSKKEQKVTGAEATKCTQVASLATKIQSQLVERQKKIEGKQNTNESELEARLQKRILELESKRKIWDAKRQENFAKLREKATTETQKQAVEQYITTVTQAIATRRTKNDLAISSFQQAVLGLKNETSSTVAQQSAGVAAKATAAVNEATAQCASGVDVTTIRADLKSKLEKIRSEAKTQREATTAKSEVEALSKIRRTAIAANNKEFSATVKTARQTLLNAFADSAKSIE